MNGMKFVLIAQYSNYYIQWISGFEIQGIKGGKDMI